MTLPRRAGADRRNSFDAVRLLAALAVVLAHGLNIAGYALPGYGQPAIAPGGPKLADAGLYVFFALSGYLVFQSLDGDPRILRFLGARALRIYPGLLANVAFCLAFGAAVTALPAAAYWGAAETWRFAAHNASVLATPTQFQLPGVLGESPWPSVNVPLWTLKYELLCYGALLALYKVAAFASGPDRRRATAGGAAALVAAAATALFVYGRAHPPPPTGGLDTLGSFSAVHVVRFFAVFFAGAACAAAEPWGRRGALAAAGVLAAGVALGPVEARFAALVLATGLGAILVGRSRLLHSRFYGRIGDLSYGTYLYAFPIQMLTLSRWLTAENFWWLTALDAALALALAFLSWRLVERPALRRKRARGEGAAPRPAGGPAPAWAPGLTASGRRSAP